MIVQTLSITIYDQSGWHWRNELYAHPTWAAIERAIRHLDQYRYPFVWLHRASVVEEDTPYDFNIIGGNGIYAFDGIVNNRSFRYIQPDAGSELVDVWTSDQGFETEAYYVCRDLDVVLHATQYFCDHGEPDPTLTWEWDDAPL
jgi:hypothetical protein